MSEVLYNGYDVEEEYNSVTWQDNTENANAEIATEEDNSSDSESTPLDSKIPETDLGEKSLRTKESQGNEGQGNLGRAEAKSFKSGDSKETANTSNGSALEEEELRDLSSTLRVSDDEFGSVRVVSPPVSPKFHNHQKASLIKHKLTQVFGSNSDDMELEEIKEELKNELERQKILQSALEASEEERNDLNAKLATLRVKLGVANANYNVSKSESDQLRKQNQEAQIQKARLEERISTCTTDLEKLKDPANPESNVNMRKVAANDRKELKRLRNDLEGIKSERSDTQKQIEIKDEKIRQLEIQIAAVKEQLDTCQSDLDVALISAEAEKKEREEVEVKLNDLIGEKMKFDDKMLKVQSKLDSTASGTTGIQKQVELFKEKEEKLMQNIATTEKKLRDAVTEIEQLKNRKMPTRTASSIKYHQYRMSRNSIVSDTTPRFSISSKGSLASSGSVGSKLSVASVGTTKSSATQLAPGSKYVPQKGPSIQPVALKTKTSNGKMR